MRSNTFIKIALVLCLPLCIVNCATDNTPQPQPVPNITSPDKLNISWDIGSLSKSNAGSFVPTFDSDNAIFTADSKGDIFKIDSSDGTIIYEFNIKRKLTAGTAISSDSIFVASLDDKLLSIDKATHKIKWEVALPTIAIEAPHVSGNIVVIRTNDSSILAYNTENGSLLWVYQRPVPSLTLRVTNSIQISSSGDVLLAGLPGGRMVVLNLINGTPIWENYVAIPVGSTDLDKLTDIAMRPVLDDKIICVATFNGKIGCMDAITSNIIWSKKFSGTAEILVDTQNVYAISQDGVVYAFDKNTGSTVWSNNVLQYRNLGSPAFLNNNIVTVDIQGYINMFNRNDGTLVARDDSNLVGGTSYPWSNGYKVIMQSANGEIEAITQ